MVALVIALFILLAMASAYLGSRQSYRAGESLSRLQESARFAFNFMARDIRQAGYFGCGGRSATLTNTLNDNTNVEYDFSRHIYGYDADPGGTSWNVALSGTVSNDALDPDPLPGSDIVIVRALMGPPAEVLQHPGMPGSPGSADIKVAAGTGFVEGDILMVTDCNAAAVLQVTNTNTGGGFDNIVHNTGATADPPGNATKVLGKEYTGGDTVKMGSFVYYIATNPGGIPALYRKEISKADADAEELVEGVENLQITYGVDQDDNYAVEAYMSGSAVETGALWEKVVSTRLEIVVRSPENGVATEPQTYSLNGASITATDRHLRQVYAATITLRNRVE